MGWGRMFLLGNVGQQMDIEEVRGQINNQFARDANQDAQIRTLQGYTREMHLYLTSVMRLLVAKGVLSEAEINDMVQQVERGEDRS